MEGRKIPEWQARSELMLGAEVLNKLFSKKVVVVGLGGVGAYAAEMIARAGVGAMLILDSDVVNASNKNRQLLALDSTIGKSKVFLMEERLKDINPEIGIVVKEVFLNQDNVERLLDGFDADIVVDAIDTLSPKIALIQYCVGKGIPLVSSMGAGAKMDATKIKVKDISKSFNCPLAYMLRKRLRKLGISKGFKVVFSEELPDTSAIVPVEEQNKKSQVGTISYMPAVFGCIVAQAVLDHLIKEVGHENN
ncbi:MAG: tRNA threonylcarbamoyladenosine dehydratase [Bacteroidia bacterium]|nr:tRNA threonylcarbamoyladenosine dehydratase [Bacteroidales bacterium]MDD3300030.1 tRNA threonylcarbamoyladenosine dehydratase [Bacteroidales bacterium]MDD3843273.1 tRNA threonylcarbamoyladenosine dehydratase [Bacteroidales bacterium]MDD4618436.1 tRNA threonylcarbamoyladenosine dehydratase [Bacteroidales bacterium]NCC46256.1 tRNA threonylcarbamoyladenosine dehydratase [Bacteroidia bacterium]